MLTYHKVVLLAQLGLPESVFNDKSLAKTNKAVDTGLALISVTRLSQRVAGTQHVPNRGAQWCPSAAQILA